MERQPWFLGPVGILLWGFMISPSCPPYSRCYALPLLPLRQYLGLTANGNTNLNIPQLHSPVTLWPCSDVVYPVSMSLSLPLSSSLTDGPQLRSIKRSCGLVVSWIRPYSRECYTGTTLTGL